MRAPLSFLKPGGPPPFDLTTLDTGFRVAQADLVALPPPAGTAALGTLLWQGKPTAGPSAAFDGFHDGTGTTFIGPTLGGKPVLDLSLANPQTRQVRASTGTANARAGVSGATEVALADGIASGLYGAANGSMWALVNLRTVPAGRTAIWSSGGAGPSILLNSASGGVIEVGNGGPDIYVTLPVPPLLTWVDILAYWTGGNVHVSLDGGVTFASHAMPNVGGTAMAIGLSQYNPANFYGLDFACSPTAYSGATWLNIHAGLKALYPAAGLA